VGVSDVDAYVFPRCCTSTSSLPLQGAELICCFRISPKSQSQASNLPSTWTSSRLQSLQLPPLPPPLSPSPDKQIVSTTLPEVRRLLLRSRRVAKRNSALLGIT
jgi:hypothetical protein